MLRSIAICALLCVSTQRGLSTGTRSNESIFSRIIDARLPNPTTIAVDSSLCTISKSTTHLRVNSSRPTCRLAVDPFDMSVQGRINAVSLNNGKILVWGIQSSEPVGYYNRTSYVLFLVDTVGCSYKIVPLPEEGLPSDWPTILPRIVAEADGDFRVFLTSWKRCDPYFYSASNNSLEPDCQPKPRRDGGLSSQFHVESYGSEDYHKLLMAYNYDDGKADIHVVDKTYYAGKTKSINGTVDAISANYGTYQNTAICSITPGKNRREVECTRFNSRLEVGMSWKLPLKADSPVTEVSIKVDKVGNTFIGVIVDSQELRCLIYNVVGELVADLDFGQLEEKYSHRELSGILIPNYEYCLVVVAHSDPDAREARHVVKCIDVSNYIQDTD